MFVNQSKYDELLSQFNSLKEQNTTLETQMETLAAQAAKTSEIQEQLNTAAGERDAALTEVNTLKQSNTDLTAQVEALTTENETLRALPGAKPATAVTETETSLDSLSDLDKLNEFCKNNANDTNACLAAINKFINQTK